jgi:transposase
MLSQDTWRRIRAFHEGGMTINELAKRFNVSYEAIRQGLRRSPRGE